MFSAHVLFRHIQTKYVISAAWYFWSASDTGYHLFGGPPEFKIRPRGFIYKIYKNFGDRLLEATDTDESDDLIVQASRRSDGSTAIMVLNLSETVTYDTQVSLANFAMTGEVEVHTMSNSNCYEGGPGPSMTTLSGQGNPINYTFAPWTVTCLVVQGVPDVPIITNAAAGNITTEGATITWDTDRASTSQVEYGTTISYGSSTAEDSSLVNSHSMNLTGLTPGKLYHYVVRSKDVDQKEGISADATFSTAVNPAVKVVLTAESTSLPTEGQTLITGSLMNSEDQLDITKTAGTFNFSVSPSNMGSFWITDAIPATGNTRDVQFAGGTYIIFKTGTTTGEATLTGSFGSLTPGTIKLQIGGGGGGELVTKVYPNPLIVSKGGQMTFSVGAATGGEVKIYTINGRLVKELVIGTGASEVDWDVLNEDGNSITAGLYLYTIIDGDGNKKTGKLAITQ
jgi:hypothetical protein